ncbi:MAG: hypothetical protein QOG14_1603 [Mycobacterium sp.]|jgi:hypothetical protein|nr:hypothetical protein [Mycobacterium sp.]
MPSRAPTAVDGTSATPARNISLCQAGPDRGLRAHLFAPLVRGRDLVSIFGVRRLLHLHTGVEQLPCRPFADASAFVRESPRLTVSQANTGEHIVSVSRLALNPETDLAGQHALILDDTWTTGGERDGGRLLAATGFRPQRAVHQDAASSPGSLNFPAGACQNRYICCVGTDGKS